jgi:hypothetical protein
VFHKKGLQGDLAAPAGWGPLEPLEDLMDSIGSSRIDFLKIDWWDPFPVFSCLNRPCPYFSVFVLPLISEGCEWGAFRHMAKTGVLNRVDQLSIELHFEQKQTNLPGPDSGVRSVFELFAACEAAQLLPFSWEVS